MASSDNTSMLDRLVFSSEMVAKYPVLKKWNDGERTVWKGGREQALLAYIKSRPDFAELKRNPKKIIKAIDYYCCNEQLLITIGRDKGRIMADLIRKHKPSVMVELGGYVGYSAIFFADELRSCNDRQPVQYWSLELDPDFAEIAQELIEIAGLSDIVKVVVGSSSDSLRQLKEIGHLERIDLLYLDHNEDELYEKDARLCDELGLLPSGSHIVADKALVPGCPGYRAYVRASANFQSQGVKGLTIPGELEDELEVTTVL